MTRVLFPVLNASGHVEGWSKTVPHAWLQQFETNVRSYHGQTLERLAERGGLTWVELWRDTVGWGQRHATDLLPIDAHREVMKSIDRWQETQGTGIYRCDVHKMQGLGTRCPACFPSETLKPVTPEPKIVTVGQLRQQSALQDSERPVVIITKHRDLEPFVKRLRVVDVYPDTTDPSGAWNSCFKIVVDVVEEKAT